MSTPGGVRAREFPRSLLAAVDKVKVADPSSSRWKARAASKGRDRDKNDDNDDDDDIIRAAQNRGPPFCILWGFQGSRRVIV
uniref:Uncharacterized protein n=1 Tax=Steinernema glaseri TaxID=37863 RepID=A0A1I7Z8D4_9BILA